VARTLEYAYDDWCIWRLAVALNRPKSERALYAQRALNYRNVFDSESGLMRGRNKNGSFQKPFSPLKWGDAFTEGNSWHYTWSVFHDPAGLIKLMGGQDKFVQMLDSVFEVPPLYDDSYYGQVIHEIREMTVMNMGNYAHGNQPAQHMIYMYNYAGQPWKAQYWLRQVMNKLYTPNADGYCGDEDNGQTSAWYVFSALDSILWLREQRSTSWALRFSRRLYCISRTARILLSMRLPTAMRIFISSRLHSTESLTPRTISIISRC
jgi:predicted alpha-1,2-mannosidase